MESVTTLFSVAHKSVLVNEGVHGSEMKELNALADRPEQNSAGGAANTTNSNLTCLNEYPFEELSLLTDQLFVTLPAQGHIFIITPTCCSALRPPDDEICLHRPANTRQEANTLWFHGGLQTRR